MLMASMRLTAVRIVWAMRIVAKFLVVCSEDTPHWTIHYIGKAADWYKSSTKDWQERRFQKLAGQYRDATQNLLCDGLTPA